MATEKYLRVTMPDGSKWDVPASVIAWSLTDYDVPESDYKDIKDWAGYPDNSFFLTTWNRQYASFLDDDAALIEWSRSDMNWEDVASVATRVEAPPINPDYQEGWVNGDKEIVEKEVAA